MSVYTVSIGFRGIKSSCSHLMFIAGGNYGRHEMKWKYSRPCLPLNLSHHCIETHLFYSYSQCVACCSAKLIKSNYVGKVEYLYIWLCSNFTDEWNYPSFTTYSVQLAKKLIFPRLETWKLRFIMRAFLEQNAKCIRSHFPNLRTNSELGSLN